MFPGARRALLRTSQPLDVRPVRVHRRAPGRHRPRRRLPREGRAPRPRHDLCGRNPLDHRLVRAPQRPVRGRGRGLPDGDRPGSDLFHPPRRMTPATTWRYTSSMFRTIIEPFKIKVVEPIRMTTPEERRAVLKQAHYNMFGIRAKDILIDLLTDSGTSAMSSEQWAAMMRGDNAYAGSNSFYRFAENAHFFKLLESGYQNKSAAAIDREMYRLSDGCTMSAKKDGLVNIGGFLGMNDGDWAQRCRNLLVLTEGFPTYGGLAGRDLDAIAQGLQEVLEEDYLKYRLRSVEYLAERLAKIGYPIVQPPGGHAVYIDARALLPHIPPTQFPAQSLCSAIYEQGGIRTGEIGNAMFGRNVGGREIPSDMDLVRMAIPRRAYTQSHIDYVVEVAEHVFKPRETLRGFRVIRQASVLRHFTIEFEPV